MGPQVEGTQLLRRPLPHPRNGGTGEVLHAPPELEGRMPLPQVCAILRDTAARCVARLNRGHEED